MSDPNEFARAKSDLEKTIVTDNIITTISVRRRARQDRFTAEDILISLTFKPQTKPQGMAFKLIDNIILIYDAVERLVKELEDHFSAKNRIYLCYLSLTHAQLRSDLHTGGVELHSDESKTLPDLLLHQLFGCLLSDDTLDLKDDLQIKAVIVGLNHSNWLKNKKSKKSKMSAKNARVTALLSEFLDKHKKFGNSPQEPKLPDIRPGHLIFIPQSVVKIPNVFENLCSIVAFVAGLLHTKAKEFDSTENQIILHHLKMLNCPSRAKAQEEAALFLLENCSQVLQAVNCQLSEAPFNLEVIKKLAEQFKCVVYIFSNLFANQLVYHYTPSGRHPATMKKVFLYEVASYSNSISHLHCLKKPVISGNTFMICCNKWSKNLSRHNCSRFKKCPQCKLGQILENKDYWSAWMTELYCSANRIFDLSPPVMCVCGVKFSNKACYHRHLKRCGRQKKMSCCSKIIYSPAPVNASLTSIETKQQLKMKKHACSGVCRNCWQSIESGPTGEKVHLCPLKLNEFTRTIYSLCVFDIECYVDPKTGVSSSKVL